MEDHVDYHADPLAPDAPGRYRETLNAFVAPVARQSDAVAKDPIVIQVAEAVYAAFGDHGVNGGLTRDELAKACSKFVPVEAFQCRFDLFVSMGRFVDDRDRARRLVDEAGTKWKLYAAWQYLTVLELESKAASEVGKRETILADRKTETAEAAASLDQLRNSGDLAQREDEARRRLNAANEVVRGLNGQRTVIDTKKAGLVKERSELIPQSARWNGQPPEEAAADLQKAVTSYVRAVSALESADEAV